jgi:hypothetical protein
VGWMHLVYNRDQWRALVNTIINLRVPWKAGSFLTIWVTISFSRRSLFHGLDWRSILKLVGALQPVMKSTSNLNWTSLNFSRMAHHTYKTLSKWLSLRATSFIWSILT